MHISGILQRVFTFFSIPAVVEYSDLYRLVLVNKAFRDAMYNWPRFMRGIVLPMTLDGAQIMYPERRSARKSSTIGYGVINVVRLSTGKLVHLQFGCALGKYQKHVLTNRNLSDIVMYAPRLKTLRIRVRTKFTTKGMSVLENLPNLRTLELPLGRRKMVWPTLKVKNLAIFGISARVRNLVTIQPHVEKLCFRRIHNFIRQDIHRMGSMFPNVTQLAMDMCFSKIGEPYCIESYTMPTKFLGGLVVLHITSSRIIHPDVFGNEQTFMRLFPRVVVLKNNIPNLGSWSTRVHNFIQYEHHRVDS
jgi:hypothetical protein